MAFLIALATLVVVAVVVLVVGAPLRRARQLAQRGPGASLATQSPDAAASASAGRVQDLEAAREAKYREIRDAELDFRTGKLSRADYDAIDTDLRAEALEILNRLEPVEEAADGEADGAGRASGPGPLEQQEGVQEEQHAEEDRPTV
jgi:hypothetical protein